MHERDLLAVDVAVLLARYGEKRVVSELARLRSVQSEDLEVLLKEAATLKARSALPRKRPDTDALVRTLRGKHPERSKELDTLYTRYQSGTFLPELKDVKRFLGRFGDVRRLKSRVDSTAAVFHRLCEIPITELRELMMLPDQRGYSSLGAISSEILKQAK